MIYSGCELQCLFLFLLPSLLAPNVSSSVSFPASSAVCLDAKSPVVLLHNHLGHLSLALSFSFVSIYIQGELFEPFVKSEVQVFFNIIFHYVLFKIYVTS